ncbi:MAG: YeeE/YedE thiosulfate transporter family protein [Myxococcota bacterium]|nr:YeeE/YedE thiosulfate transporter family protein [Myxococcota bacterium]
MDGPITVEFGLGHGTEMVVAVLIGIGFGFFLERAGFGRSDNLASIFYGRDFRVMRVMFTAIVTAMIGLYFFDIAGVLPLGSIGLLDTYLLPQLVGGLLLGAGFIIGGYCPGTSIVGVMSGKVDAMLFVLGIPLGSLVFTVSYDSIANFHTNDAMGRIILSEFFGLPSGVTVFAVVLFAIGALFAVSKIEAWVNKGRNAS